ncbi:MAG: ABC transporter substrate-binding protein [Acidobacteria bacterium]|nr:ABC transporter substrate-binding protein [Acidobacteriota bacterium]
MKRFILGLVLLCLAAAVLLLSDVGRREKNAAPKGRRIAIFQFGDNPVMDEAAGGVLEALRKNGFVPGKNLQIDFFNAHGSLVEADSIARALVDGRYDLVITLATPALQSFAGANRDGRTPHLFTVVTDPYQAGVGLKRGDPSARPRHLTGVITAEPVRRLFELARQVNPGLKRVGTLWNPAEDCSRSTVAQARAVCAELGIALREVPVTTTTDVPEGIRSLLSPPPDAVWIGGDNTVFSALPAVTSACAQARVPILAHTPAHLADGLFLCLGADFYASGKITGALAARLLSGEEPSREPIVDAVPTQVGINLTLSSSVGSEWAIPASVSAAADVILDPTGLHRKAPPLERVWNVHVVSFNETGLSEDAILGLRRGLPDTGLVEGRDYRLQLSCAQGSLENLPGIFDAGVSAGDDLFLVVSNPVLQVAMERAGDIPVVFTAVLDPKLFGAGRSDTDHLPGFTGIYTIGAYGEMLDFLRKYFPSIRKVGTLFSPAEVSSAFNVTLTRKLCIERGMSFEAVPVSAPSEIPEAASALCARRVQAVMQIVDNQVLGGFAALSDAARRAGVPLVCFNREGVEKGAALGFCRDYVDAGRQAAAVAARLMRGELPARVPFTPMTSYRVVVSTRNARALGFTLPDAIVKTADEVIP